MSDRRRIRIARDARPSEADWTNAKAALRERLQPFVDGLATIPEEEKPGGFVILRLRENIYAPIDVQIFAQRFGFSRVGATGLPHSPKAPHAHHLLGREADLVDLLRRLPSWRMGAPGWSVVLHVTGIEDRAAYAYPTDFPGQYLAHAYSQVPGWFEALQHVAQRLGGAVTREPRDWSSRSAGMLPLTIDAGRLEDLRAFPLLHSVQGQHRITLSSAS